MSVKVSEIHFRSRDIAEFELVFSWSNQVSNTVNTLVQYQSLHKKRPKLAIIKLQVSSKFIGQTKEINATLLR